MTEVRALTGVKAGKYEVTLVSGKNILIVFPQVQGRIEEAFEERAFREYDIEELRRRLIEGEAQLWLVAENGARVVMIAVTRVLRYPSVKRLAIDLIVGEDMEGCITALEIGATWARQFGCTEIEASCRPGVRKAMEKHGFVKQYEVIVKSISGSTH
jgi:hypothetical protein